MLRSQTKPPSLSFRTVIIDCITKMGAKKETTRNDFHYSSWNFDTRLIASWKLHANDNFVWHEANDEWRKKQTYTHMMAAWVIRRFETFFSVLMIYFYFASPQALYFSSEYF